MNPKKRAHPATLKARPWVLGIALRNRLTWFFSALETNFQGPTLLIALKSYLAPLRLALLLTEFLHGVHMHHGHIQVTKLVQEAVVDLAGYRMTFGHRQLGIHHHVDLRAQPVTQPPSPHLRHILHALDVASRVADLVYQRRVHPVQQAGEDRLAGLPDDNQDRDSDQQPKDRVCQRLA